MSLVPEVADQAWVTVATNVMEAYGTLVLGHSLRQVGTKRAMLVMVTPEIPSSMRDMMATVYNEVKEVNIHDSNDESNLTLMGRPDLGATFIKLHCWRLTQFSKGVFLDAATMLVQNCDELFDEREELSAARDATWPDWFNTGVFVFKPSEDTYGSLLHFAVSLEDSDEGDQSLLNRYFSNWATDLKKHLPFVYNMVSEAPNNNPAAAKQYGNDVKIVHFQCAKLLWKIQQDPVSRNTGVLRSPGHQHRAVYLKMWWDLLNDSVLPEMPEDYGVYPGSLNLSTMVMNEAAGRPCFIGGMNNKKTGTDA